jgi:hypothetical protein
VATLDSTSGATALEQLLPGYSPLADLWAGSAPAFPSENSARWALRQHRPALIDAEALALFRGRLFVHRERLLGIVLKHAVDACRQKYGTPA